MKHAVIYGHKVFWLQQAERKTYLAGKCATRGHSKQSAGNAARSLADLADDMMIYG